LLLEQLRPDNFANSEIILMSVTMIRS